MFAAGELAMTAHDLALWDESLIAQSILKPESYKQMFTEVKLKDGKGTHYGLGVGVTTATATAPLNIAAKSPALSPTTKSSSTMAWPWPSSPIRTPSAQPPSSSIWPLRWCRLRPPRRAAGHRPLPRPAAGPHRPRLLAPNLSDYFTAEAIADFQSSLAPLGEPLTFHQTREELRGGMTFRAFEIVYPGKRLTLTTYTYPDGKLEQYLIAPAE
jgi:D-alanyl-D-alanine carboxypeptidase